MRILLNGFLILVIWAIPCRYWYVCKIKQQCGSTAISVPEPAVVTRTADLALTEDGAVVIGNREQFHFEVGSVGAELTTDNENFLDQSAQWLKANPDRRLVLIGAWRPSEAGQSSGYFENLGLARAAWAREQFVRRGIPEESIGLDHVASADEMLVHPLRFEVVPRKVTEAGAPAREAGAFTFTNMQFSGANFASNSAQFEPNSSFIAYADSLRIYLDQHTGKSLKVTGHTDERGSVDANKALGQRRADAVRQWLVGQGIRSRIETHSAGASEPVAVNDTEEGRARNRRVQITIQ